MDEDVKYRAEYRTYKDDSLGNTDIDDLTHEFPAPDDKRALQIAKQHASELVTKLEVDHVSLMNLLRYVKIE